MKEPIFVSKESNGVGREVLDAPGAPKRAPAKPHGQQDRVGGISTL